VCVCVRVPRLTRFGGPVPCVSGAARPGYAAGPRHPFVGVLTPVYVFVSVCVCVCVCVYVCVCVCLCVCTVSSRINCALVPSLLPSNSAVTAVWHSVGTVSVQA
jgi:hypothetical protein